MISGNTDGEGIRIALLDTGVDFQHPDFRDARIRLRDFCNPSGSGADADGHGTHCAGVILNAAPSCHLLSGTIAARSGLFTYDALSDALQWADTEAADVICVCSGERYGDGIVLGQIEKLQDRGCTMVAAIGNSGSAGKNAGLFPARYPGVIAVGSVDPSENLSDFTDLPSDADVFCLPGEDFEGPWPGGQRAILSGTSVSAARLTGLLGLLVSGMKMKGQTIAPSILKEAVRSSSVAKESRRGSYFVVDPVRLLSTF